jgi:hypothetical protein
MFDILTILPGKKKRATSGWYSFNAVCCHHRGHKADKRGRAGIIFDGENNWSYHCFNCNFKCGFQLGKSISKPTRQLLNWGGIDDAEISKWNLESLRHRDILDVIRPAKPVVEITFEQKDDPEGCVPINNKEARFKKYVKYLDSRGLHTGDYIFKATPDDSGRNADRIIIPFRYNGRKVGHTSRYIDGRSPKYINDMPPGFLFGCNLQKPEWEVCLVFEGVIDALTLRGCAVMHNTISDAQASILRNMHKRIIVVPDMDKSGLAIIDRALELGFQVSLPDWGPGIKDANDAVLKYGRLPTLLSILQNATNSKIKLQMMRTKIDKRL